MRTSSFFMKKEENSGFVVSGNIPVVSINHPAQTQDDGIRGGTLERIMGLLQ